MIPVFNQITDLLTIYYIYLYEPVWGKRYHLAFVNSVDSIQPEYPFTQSDQDLHFPHITYIRLLEYYIDSDQTEHCAWYFEPTLY